jgi:hypothetical protein
LKRLRKLITGAFLMQGAMTMSVEGQERDPAGVPGVSKGMRVRVRATTLRSDAYIGQIDSIDTSIMILDTLGVRRRLGFDTGPVLVDEFRRVTIQLSAIDQIDTYGGKTVRAATVRGLVIGALAGGVLFGLGDLPEVNPTASDFFKGAPKGLIIGGVIGGVVGYALGGERWLPARLPVK